MCTRVSIDFPTSVVTKISTFGPSLNSPGVIIVPVCHLIICRHFYRKIILLNTISLFNSLIIGVYLDVCYELFYAHTFLKIIIREILRSTKEDK